MTSYYHAGMEHIRAQSARYGSAPTRRHDSDQLSQSRGRRGTSRTPSAATEEDMDSKSEQRSARRLMSNHELGAPRAAGLRRRVGAGFVNRGATLVPSRTK